ncbi:MAG: hypothetical protein KAS72_14375 [Phycisphaerales bacterium]|nr:hypothetical protein [Phycisphaerales bacterium]
MQAKAIPSGGAAVNLRRPSFLAVGGKADPISTREALAGELTEPDPHRDYTGWDLLDYDAIRSIAPSRLSRIAPMDRAWV